MQLQKEVKSNPKQPRCKKSVWPQESYCGEKGVKSKVAAKKWLWWYTNGKILIAVNLVPNLSETKTRQHKFTWIVVFRLAYHHSHFLAADHLGFHIFVHNGLLRGQTLFLQMGCFGLDNSYCTYQLTLTCWRISIITRTAKLYGVIV